MKKKIQSKKIFLIAIILLILILFIPSICFADDLGLGDLDLYRGDGGNATLFQNKANKVISIIQTVGSISSVVVLVIIGIKYMVSSIEEKAEYKKTMLGYVIGCALVFALSNLLMIVYNIAKNI